MIYINNKNSDKEIKKIVNQKNNDDCLYFIILCQFGEMYHVPKEIVKFIFMLTYRYTKIKNINNPPRYETIIINTDKTHLFVNKFLSYDNKKFIDVIESGIKYVYFDDSKNFILTLGLDGILRLVHLFNNEIIILDKKIRHMRFFSGSFGTTHHAKFYVISRENYLFVATFTYHHCVNRYEYIKNVSDISFPIKKIKGSLSIIISINNVAYWDWDWNKEYEMKNVVSAWSTSIHVSRSWNTILFIYAFLIDNGELYYIEKGYEDFKMTLLPFSEKIVYVTGNKTHIYVIATNGCSYRLDMLSNHKIFIKLCVGDNVKSIHCFKEYTMFLSKTNKVNFLWD